MNYPKSLEEFFSNNNPRLEECALLRSILGEFEEIEEKLKWGLPVYTIDDKNLIGIGSFKNWSALWFYQGVFLIDKDKKLVNAQPGTTKAQLQWRFANVEEINGNKELIRQYIQETIDNHHSGKIVPITPKRTTQLEVPELLQEEFSNDKKLKEAFELLSLACRNEYIEYVADAKKDETKLRRIEKIKPMILDGIGLNDKYK